MYLQDKQWCCEIPSVGGRPGVLPNPRP